MISLPRRLLRAAAGVLLAVLIGGFAAAALVRYSPGFDIDDNAWNPQISAETARAIRVRREAENHLPQFYARYLLAAAQGNFGHSNSLNAPVSDLLMQRAGVTARLIVWGVGGGMLLAGWLAWLAVWPRQPALEAGVVSLNGILVAIPPAVLALGFFFSGAPLGLAFALVILPRVFGTLRVALQDVYRSPALLAARARGLSPGALALRYVLAPLMPQLVALTGVALVLAFGAAIPIEALCDVPGIGQLAWQAALARDLPVLCGLALLITFFVTMVDAIGEFFLSAPDNNVVAA